MRVGIDARYLSHGLVGGVHTYVKNFVPALAEIATDHELYLYADTKCPFELEPVPGHVVVRRLPWKGPMSTILNDFSMWRYMAADHLDVVHYPANYGFGPPGAHTVITVHDVINVLPLTEIVRGHPKTPRAVAMMTYLHWCTRLALRRASLLLTVSAHAQHAIADQSGFAQERIVPVHHAPAPDLQRVTDTGVLDDVRRRYGLIRPFVLADALKNPGVLIEAWRKLPSRFQDRYLIVFFSRNGHSPRIIDDAIDVGQARLLSCPPRADLIALYSMAEAFVFPSWLEGFGIPALEAMTCGSPVIASDRGAIPEVVGDAALLADAEDADTFARHLTAVLEEPGVAARLRKRGYARASQFSWRKTAQQILDSYSRALSYA